METRKRENLTPRIYGHCVDLAATGLRAEGIADILGVSLSAVQRIIRADKAAAAADYDVLRIILPQSKRTVALACEKYQIDPSIPNTPTKPKEAKQEPKTDNTAQAIISILDALHELTEAVKANGKTLDTLTADLAQLRMITASFRGEMPGHVAKVVESININGDIATKEHQKQTDLLASIKINTKRRQPQE
jgi:hypothetical protein